MPWCWWPWLLLTSFIDVHCWCNYYLHFLKSQLGKMQSKRREFFERHHMRRMEWDNWGRNLMLNFMTSAFFLSLSFCCCFSFFFFLRSCVASSFVISCEQFGWGLDSFVSFSTCPVTIKNFLSSMVAVILCSSLRESLSWMHILRAGFDSTEASSQKWKNSTERDERQKNLFNTAAL